MEGLNEAELRRYLQRVGDRWPIERAFLGGARVADVAAGVSESLSVACVGPHGAEDFT